MTLAEQELNNDKYNEALVIETSVGKVPVWKFIEKFLYIETKEGSAQKFILNDAQVDLYKEMCEQRIKGEPIRVNILKARQIGFSTFIAAVIFTLTIFVPNQKAAIVADISEHATNLFNKYKFFYDRLPKELKIPLVNSNAKELIVSFGNGIKSSIRITVQGEGAGRSGTYQYLHLSECAFWADLKKTLVSLLQTVSISNLNSMIFLETTGNGFNEYKSRWDKDITGVSQYKALFYGWWQNPEYKLKYTGFQLYDWEEKLMKELNLSYEQISWYRQQYNAFDQDLDDLKQEYPSTPIEAFKTSGNSVFNLELIQLRKEEILKESPIKKQGLFSYITRYSQDGANISITERKFIESKKGELVIFKEVEPGHPYVVNADTAMGGEDYFAIQVLNNFTGEQVAVYHAKKVDEDEVAFQLVCLGYYYNTALICCETNISSQLLVIADKCGYPFIYQDTDYEDLSNRYANRFGYKTKQNNRQVMISLFKQAFRDNYRMINDYETLCEMEEFVIERNEKSGKEKAQAISGSHDDLVMAMCGVFLIRHQQEFIPKVELGGKKNLVFDPFKCNDEKELSDSEVFIRW